MNQVINSNWRIVILSLCVVGLLFSVTSPTASAAINSKQANAQEEMPLTKKEKKEIDKVIKKTSKEILKTAPRMETGSSTVYAQGWVSVGRKLITLFGEGYVKRTLPKKIYTKFPSSVKSKVSEAGWVGCWNAFVLMGPLDQVKNTVADFLKPYVWDWVATSCGFLVQGIIYALI